MHQNAIALVVSVISMCIHHSDCDGAFRKEPRKPFYLDNYDDCSRPSKVYCRVTAKLIPKTGLNGSDIWETPPSFIKEVVAARPDEPVHGCCIEKGNDFDDNVSVSSYIKNFHYGKPYNAEVLSYTCQTDYYEYVGLHDGFVCAVFLSYGLLIIYATKMDTKWRKDHRKHIPQRVQNIVEALSFKRNLKSLFSNNDRIQDTKVIQGLRVFVMLEVICLHTFLSLMSNYLVNFEDLEMTLSRTVIYYFASPLITHTVQAFFFISGFLLAIQLNEFNDVSKAFTLRNVLVSIMNRYVRLIPPIAAQVLLSSTVFEMVLLKGVNFDFIQHELENCRNFGWATIFLISNNFPQYKTCCAWLWYTSADFQLYTLSLILIYLMFRFKKNAAIIYITSMFLSAFIHMYIMYTRGTNTVTRITNHTEMRFGYLLRSVDFQYLYTSTISNVNTYFIGVGFGFLYYKNKGKHFFKNTITLVRLWMVFGIFIIITCYISTRNFSGISKLIFGSIWKPIYAVNVGIVLLSLLLESPGPLKYITEHLKLFLESSVFQVLAKVTYCTYVFHMCFIVPRMVTTRPLRYSEIGMVPAFFKDVLLGVLLGTIMHLLIEAPAIKLQKMFLPQIRRRKVIDN